MKEQFAKIGRDNEKESFLAAKTLQRYNSSQVLKILSVLQTQPLNHGKYIRLEIAIAETLNNLNLKREYVGLGPLIKDIIKSCPPSLAEDPPEEFFTENLVFENENFVVFPGISTDGTEIVQGLLNCLVYKDSLRELFIKAAFAVA